MIIQSTRVWYRERFSPLQLKVEDGTIKAVLPYGSLPVNEDFGSNRVLPGLLDIHTHGYKGLNSSQATEEWLRAWSAQLAAEGVTGFLPTGWPTSEERQFEGYRTIAKMMDEGDYAGARILGVNLEAVWIGDEYRRGVDVSWQMVPDEACVDRYIEACGGHLRYVMVAPEMFEGDMSVVRYLASKGITVGAGHTAASFEDIALAREAGLTGFIHLYHAMSRMHHRSLGPVGAALYYDDMYAECLGDSNLESVEAIRLLAKIKGKDHLIIITDSTGMKGMPAGEYGVEELAGILDEYGSTGANIVIPDLADGDGCFDKTGEWRGSIASMVYRLKCFVETYGIDEVTAINACTCNPARYLHLVGKGLLDVNYDADITVIDDDYRVLQTFVAGEGQL